MSIKSPSPSEVEKLRLVLSSYQDGTGQLAQSDGYTLPGWRDFERSVAIIFGGIAQESKAIFDVLVPIPDDQNYYGISCKMRRELKVDTQSQNIVPMELSNAARQFWAEIKKHRIDEQTYKNYPDRVGKAIISLVQGWHESASKQMGRNIDLARSSYLVLLWNKRDFYQLFQFSHQLPNPKSLYWHFPKLKDGSISNHLQGDDQSGKVFEW